jgi:hypothetical protein
MALAARGDQALPRRTHRRAAALAMSDQERSIRDCGYGLDAHLQYRDDGFNCGRCEHGRYVPGSFVRKPRTTGAGDQIVELRRTR